MWLGGIVRRSRYVSRIELVHPAWKYSYAKNGVAWRCVVACFFGVLTRIRARGRATSAVVTLGGRLSGWLCVASGTLPRSPVVLLKEMYCFFS